MSRGPCPKLPNFVLFCFKLFSQDSLHVWQDLNRYIRVFFLTCFGSFWMSAHLIPYNLHESRGWGLSLPGCSVKVADKQKPGRMSGGLRGKEPNALWLFQMPCKACERTSSANANGRSNKAVSEAGANTPKIENTGSDLGDVSLHEVW